MAKLSGYVDGHRRVDGALCMVEYVRTSEGVIWSRVKGSKWTLESSQDVTEIAYKGNTWCVHPRGLELKSKLVRLPK